jgi:hypothetical protein
VLMLRFNKALSSYLAGQLGDDATLRNVEVRPFDPWLARLTWTSPRMAGAQIRA